MKQTTDTPTPSIVKAEFLEPRELAAELGVSVRTVHRWNTLRIGPPRTVVARTVLYRRSTFLNWLASREEKPRRRRA
jgi:DNA-binding transcriptional regulator YiaG